MKQNNLDEMQEQKMLKIEHNGFWLGFWALLGSAMVQLLCFRSIKLVTGELLVFFGLCIYLTVDCLKNGLWDRQLKANGKTNLLASLLAAAAVFLFDLAYSIRGGICWQNALLIGALASLVTFALCMGLLTLCAKLYKKRKNQLEEE